APCEWNPAKDMHVFDFNESMLLSSIAERQGISKEALLEEFDKRKNVLHWMRERNIRSYKDVATIIAEYYARPKQMYDKIISGEEVKAIAASRNS
ncbi:MAG: hypothetical protein QXD70_03320, partial [Candidatus Bathyarchaeia archaeon]